LKTIVGLFVSLIAILVAMFIGHHGDYPVARLVTDNPSLPSETLAGIRLHMRIVDGLEGAHTIIVLHGGPGGDWRCSRTISSLRR